MSQPTLLCCALLVAALSSCKKDELNPTHPISCFVLDDSVYQTNEWIKVYNCSEDAEVNLLYALESGQDTGDVQPVLAPPAEVDSFRISTPGVYRIVMWASNGSVGSRIDEYMVPVLIED